MANIPRLSLIILLLGLMIALPCLLERRGIAARSRTTSDQLSADIDELKARLDDAETRRDVRDVAESAQPEINELRSRLAELRQTETRSTCTKTILDVGVIAGLLMTCIGNVVYLYRRSHRA